MKNRAFNPRNLLLAMTSRLVAAAVYIPMAISLAALIFAGGISGRPGTGHRPAPGGALLFSAIVSLTTSFQASISVPQDTPAVLLALLSASIFSGLPYDGAGGSAYATVAAAIILNSLLTGLVFLRLGLFRLGDLVRFIPYPVIGGFLAGTGWLLCRGALGVMTGMNIGLDTFEALFQPEIILQWSLGVLYGTLLMFLLRRFSHLL